ncbi:TetR-like C-terminal domain-containing protein [Microbacterium horticulturae]|uniref:TetR-like C-terminal domain-containing protein n=1 Tax=Microbacterium horticulturae TaxID=3028316 RepID=A0ABY8C1H9_9MICO|nr:TetR-like C-terminal domain-containing protein [Microbacterium sp. KACC 23027]WEG08911.1 TetR-like C-terminal domain-containing protein [Microbacterium sp. KACC 23027]
MSIASPVGRPRDPDVDASILDATADLLAEKGPTAMTVDAVAAAAGCGKAAIYRRWAGKTELVVAAVRRLYLAPEVPDTGTLRGDLLVAIGHYSGRDDRDARVLANVLAEAQNASALRAAAYESVGRPPVDVLYRVMARAIERGELADDAPVDLVATIVPAVAFQTLTSQRRTLTEAEVVELVDRVVIPALTSRAADR